ncbi:MAG: hypothetical protein ACYCOU_24160 [Sulfobacillus sp.]
MQHTEHEDNESSSELDTYLQPVVEVAATDSAASPNDTVIICVSGCKGKSAS